MTRLCSWVPDQQQQQDLSEDLLLDLRAHFYPLQARMKPPPKSQIWDWESHLWDSESHLWDSASAFSSLKSQIWDFVGRLMYSECKAFPSRQWSYRDRSRG